jgi:DNA-binding transcriptional ArsR family regulator
LALTEIPTRENAAMKSFIAAASALSDEHRVRALLSLRGGELCMCQIIALLKLAPSTVSKHMAILKQAGFVDSRKEERWIHYRLSDSMNRSPVLKKAMHWVFDSLNNNEVVLSDGKKLAAILRIDRETLCRNRLQKTR